MDSPVRLSIRQRYLARDLRQVFTAPTAIVFTPPESTNRSACADVNPLRSFSEIQRSLLRAAGEQEDIRLFFARVVETLHARIKRSLSSFFVTGHPRRSTTTGSRLFGTPRFRLVDLNERLRFGRTGECPPARLLHAGGLCRCLLRSYNAIHP